MTPNRELMANLINNISLVSSNIIRIFDVLRETNFVKIQELTETIHEMFVKLQIGDDNTLFNNLQDIRQFNQTSKNISTNLLNDLNLNNLEQHTNLSSNPSNTNDIYPFENDKNTFSNTNNTIKTIKSYQAADTSETEK